MFLTAMTTAAALLYPVTVDDARLREEGTIVSEAAHAAIQSNELTIYCLDLPESAGSHTRACLTREEWDDALQLAERDAAHQDSVRARDRAIALADIYLR